VKLAGSCECGKVSFTVESDTPVPFMFCFCSICRKTAGAAFGCNIMGRRATLKVKGKAHLKLHRARIRRAGGRRERSHGERWFCGACGTHLYLLDQRWPDDMWPNAGAIDTPLPAAPEHVYMMTEFKPRWVPEQILAKGPRYREYPPLSIASWHEAHGLYERRKPAKPARKRRAAARKRASSS
jgi:hypothetical protein